jgi:hypothetical protein
VFSQPRAPVRRWRTPTSNSHRSQARSPMKSTSTRKPSPTRSKLLSGAHFLKNEDCSFLAFAPHIKCSYSQPGPQSVVIYDIHTERNDRDKLHKPKINWRSWECPPSQYCEDDKSRSMLKLDKQTICGAE